MTVCARACAIQIRNNSMKRRVPNSALGSEYDKFLFAPIGEERNGMPLSVVSLLGRMDLDPWEEACSLAKLPPDDAARKLTSYLRALPDQSIPHLGPEHTATRLIELLPGRSDANGPPSTA
jgi:hypothetical protein